MHLRLILVLVLLQAALLQLLPMPAVVTASTVPDMTLSIPKPPPSTVSRLDRIHFQIAVTNNLPLRLRSVRLILRGTAQNWATIQPQNLTLIGPGERSTFTVYVSIPEEANSGEYNLIIEAFACKTEPDDTASSAVWNFTIPETLSVSLSSSHILLQPQKPVTLEMTLKNLSRQASIYNVTFTTSGSLNKVISLPKGLAVLRPGETSKLTATLNLPAVPDSGPTSFQGLILARHNAGQVEIPLAVSIKPDLSQHERRVSLLPPTIAGYPTKKLADEMLDLMHAAGNDVRLYYSHVSPIIETTLNLADLAIITENIINSYWNQSASISHLAKQISESMASEKQSGAARETKDEVGRSAGTKTDGQGKSRETSPGEELNAAFSIIEEIKNMALDEPTKLITKSQVSTKLMPSPEPQGQKTDNTKPVQNSSKTTNTGISGTSDVNTINGELDKLRTEISSASRKIEEAKQTVAIMERQLEAVRNMGLQNLNEMQLTLVQSIIARVELIRDVLKTRAISAQINLESLDTVQQAENEELKALKNANYARLESDHRSKQRFLSEARKGYATAASLYQKASMDSAALRCRTSESKIIEETHILESQLKQLATAAEEDRARGNSLMKQAESSLVPFIALRYYDEAMVAFQKSAINCQRLQDTEGARYASIRIREIESGRQSEIRKLVTGTLILTLLVLITIWAAGVFKFWKRIPVLRIQIYDRNSPFHLMRRRK